MKVDVRRHLQCPSLNAAALRVEGTTSGTQTYQALVAVEVCATVWSMGWVGVSGRRSSMCAYSKGSTVCVLRCFLERRATEKRLSNAFCVFEAPR